jgi:hypothetical protein
MLAHLRAAWRYLRESEKAINRARTATETDLREAFLILALDLIQKAKQEIQNAVKIKQSSDP